MRVAVHVEDHVSFTYGSGVAEELGKFRESRVVAAEVIIGVTMGTLSHSAGGVNWSDNMMGEATKEGEEFLGVRVSAQEVW